MGLTARGVWKSLFCCTTSPLPSPVSPPRSPPALPAAVCLGGESKSSLFLLFSPFFPGVTPRGRGARPGGRGAEEFLGKYRAGKGQPRARRKPRAAGWAGAGSTPPCAPKFPYFHGNTQIPGDPSSPRGRGRTRAWGWVFSGHPKIPSCICACASEGISGLIPARKQRIKTWREC